MRRRYTTSDILGAKDQQLPEFVADNPQQATSNRDDMYSPETFQHQAVRDLVWLLTTPQLCHCTAESWQIPPPDWDSLVQLDHYPNTIEAFLCGRKAQRLGHYHEQLWLFYFQQHPDLQLLASNLVIQGKQRTLGEFDVLIKDHRDGLTWHLELAIKFYLGTQTGWGAPEKWSHWLGVACQDSMEHKWQRLFTQQLTLSEDEEVRRKLLEHTGKNGINLIPDRSSALTRGCLFYPGSPTEGTLPEPEGMNPKHLKGQWITLQQWLKQKGQHTNDQWRICRKPHWMAPPVSPEWLPESDLVNQLINELKPSPEGTEARTAVTDRKKNKKPQMGAEGVLLENRSGERLFVVADNWPGYLPLPWHRL